METGYIKFTKEVAAETIDELRRAASKMIDENVRSINILLSSSGGVLSEGIKALNFLKSLSVELNTYNVGVVNSAAIPIFLAGTGRFVVSGSSFTVHSVAAKLKMDSSAQISENIVRDLLRDMESANQSIATIYSEQTGIDSAKFEGMISSGMMVLSTDAEILGFAKNTETVQIPNDAKYVSITD